MKTRNRLLCLVLVLTMILAMVPVVGAVTEEASLWYTNGPSERIAFSGSAAALKGDTWNFKFYYGTEASSAVVTSGTLETNNPSVISLTQNGYGDWDAAMAAAGTATLTFTPKNSSGSFTMNVTVTESASGDNSQNEQMYFKPYNGQSSALMDAETLVRAPGPGSVIGEFYIDNGCTKAVSVESFVANDNVVVSADSSSGYKTVTLKASGDFTLTAVVEGTTYSIDVSVGSDGSLPGPSGPQGNAIYIGDNYVVGFGMRDTSGALTINEGGLEMARGTSWEKAEGNPLVKDWNLEVVAGTKNSDSTDAGGYSYYEEDKNATITINKVWIERVDGDEGTFSLSENGDTEIDLSSSNTRFVDVYVKEGYVGGCVIWANVTATKNNDDSVTGDIGLRLRTWKDASYVYTRPENDTVKDLNAYLEELAKTVDPNSGVQSTYVVNLAPGTYTGQIVIPDEFTGRHPGTCNMLQLIGASGADTCIGIGAEGCTYLNGGINADGGHLDAVDHVHFIANEDVTNTAGETAALYNGYIHNVQNCSFKGYDIVADANNGMINLSSGNILYKNDICFRLDLESVPYDNSRNTWQYNTFIENGTAVRFDSFNVFINPYYFRIIESNFIDNDTDFDVNTSATVYMYQNYFGDIHNQAKDAAVDNMDQFLTELAAIRTPEQYKNQKLITSNSPNIDKVQKSKVNTSPYREKFVLSTDELPSQSGSSNPAPAAATMSLRSVSLLAEEEETDYENKLVADWNLDTEILNAEADNLKIDASSFDEETENDKVISVVEVTVTETPDSIEISEKLLGTWNFGTDGGSGTTGDFNAKLTVVEGTDKITVTVVYSDVLTAKRPTLTIPTDYSSAAVTLGGSDVTSSIDADGNVSFTVAEAGEYVITNTEPASLWFINGPGVPRAFSGSLTEPQGANWTMYLFYGTYSDVWNGSSVELNTKKTGTLTPGDSEIISVSGNDDFGWQLSMLSQGTTTLTYKTDTDGDNVNETFELTVTVGPPMSEDGDSGPIGKLCYRTLSVSDDTVTEDDTSELKDYRGLASGTPVGNDVFVRFYFVVDGNAIVADGCTLTSSDTSVASVTAIENMPGGFKISVLKEGTTNFRCEYGDISSETGMTFSSSGGDNPDSEDQGGPPVPTGSAATIGDYIVGFIWEVGGAEGGGSESVINNGNLGWRHDAEITGNDGYTEFGTIQGIGVGDTTNDNKLTTTSGLTVAVKKIEIDLTMGNEGDVSFSDSNSVAEKVSTGDEPLDVTNLKVYAKDAEFDGLIKATFDVSGNGIEGTRECTAGFRINRNFTYSADCSKITDATVLNKALAALASSEGQNIQNVQLGSHVIGDVVLPETGNFNFQGANGGTILYGSMDLNGHTSDVKNIFFIADKDKRDTKGLFGGACHNLTGCFFYNYDIAADATDGFITVRANNLFVNNEIAIKVNAENAKNTEVSVTAGEHNVFINNGTAVQIISLPKAVSSFAYRITQSIFLNNGIDFDAQHGGKLYMYHNYYGHYKVENEYPRPQPGKYGENKDNSKVDLKLDVLKEIKTVSSYDLHYESRGAKLSESNGSVVITNTRGDLPITDWWTHNNIEINNVFSDGGAQRPDEMINVLSNDISDTQEEEYTIRSVSDWESKTEIINDDADKLKIDASSFDEETENDKVISVVEVTVTETSDSIDISEKLLGTWNFGKAGGSGTTGDFNAKLTVVEETDEITVTVVESAVLTAKQPTLTVPCDFDYATVTCDSEEVDSVLDTENDVITFVVEKGGEYVITKGEAPDDGTGDDTDRPIDTNVVTSSGDTDVTTTGAIGEIEHVNAVAAVVTNAEAEGLGGYASDAAVDVSNDSNIETSATAALNKNNISAGEDEELHIHVQTYLDIDVVKADLGSNNTSAETVEKTITLDIQPMVQHVASYEDDPQDLETEGNDKNAVVLSSEKLEVTTPVVLTIPLPAGFVDDGVETIYITHIKDDGTEYVYEGTVSTINGQLCVTFTNPHGFSIFVIANSDPSVASVDDTKCATFATAVQIVDNGGTIKVTKDCSDESAAVVSKEITFTVLANSGIEYNLKAGFGYTMTTEEVEGGVKYIFTKDDVEYGDIILPDVSGGADDTIRVEDLKDTSAFDSVLGVYTMQILSGTGSFVDVSKSDWFYSDVTALVSKGVINGYPDGSFRPQGVVTWGEALKLVMKAVGYGDIDANNGHWASGFMAMAIEKGLIPGEVELDAAINRGEIADLTAKAMKLGSANISNPFDDEAPASALALYEAGIIKGSADNGKLLYRAESTITRAEMAAIIWRVYCAK